MALFVEGGSQYYKALWVSSENEWDNNRGKPVPLALIAENPFKISEFHSDWPVFTCTLGLDREDKGHTRVMRAACTCTTGSTLSANSQDAFNPSGSLSTWEIIAGL